MFIPQHTEFNHSIKRITKNVLCIAQQNPNLHPELIDAPELLTG